MYSHRTTTKKKKDNGVTEIYYRGRRKKTQTCIYNDKPKRTCRYILHRSSCHHPSGSCNERPMASVKPFTNMNFSGKSYCFSFPLQIMSFSSIISSFWHKKCLYPMREKLLNVFEEWNCQRQGIGVEDSTGVHKREKKQDNLPGEDACQQYASSRHKGH